MYPKNHFLLFLVFGGLIQGPLALSAPESCDFVGEATRSVVIEEADREGMRIYTAVLAVGNQYEQVRNTRAMQEVPLPEGASRAYWQALLADRSANSSGFVQLVTIPPVLLLVLGSSAITEDVSRVAGSLALGAVAVSSITSVWLSVGVGNDLSTTERLEIRRRVEASIAEPAVYLGHVLHWSSSQRTRFSEALHAAILNNLISRFREGEGDLASRLVTGLREIDFIRLIEGENLASETQIQALRQIRSLRWSTARIRNSQDFHQIDRLLRKEADSPSARIADFTRLHAVLLATRQELPAEGAARNAVDDVVRQIAETLERLRAYCEAGF